MDTTQFDYQLTKDGRVLLYWQGKLIKTLAGHAAQDFRARLATIDEGDDAALDLLLARVTGNFKRGNEREGKRKRR